MRFTNESRKKNDSRVFHCRHVLRWLETLFEKCEKNGFEYDIVDYYRVLKGKE